MKRIFGTAMAQVHAHELNGIFWLHSEPEQIQWSWAKFVEGRLWYTYLTFFDRWWDMYVYIYIYIYVLSFLYTNASYTSQRSSSVFMRLHTPWGVWANLSNMVFKESERSCSMPCFALATQPYPSAVEKRPHCGTQLQVWLCHTLESQDISIEWKVWLLQTN